MNTFAAMKPAPRPAEAVAIRSGAEAVEASADGVAEAFGAVAAARPAPAAMITAIRAMEFTCKLRVGGPGQPYPRPSTSASARAGGP